ncbi:hypothetical protein Desal_2199 [Maridesulfovibrio salexigens DSM 2638]|uniref:Uncharacterized protein n=1 Tax=Maridesulfovibrio salexigens (strain ATCC 14822 / DSM 2638 / NCIMB 8403 / VKM B-1763) TaxID=526222 RepID=C6BW54_MARSD|nr:hypothetical protein Desal_2199 [Maridesulfovibrio salexigens DSM 2638]
MSDCECLYFSVLKMYGLKCVSDDNYGIGVLVIP